MEFKLKNEEQSWAVFTTTGSGLVVSGIALQTVETGILNGFAPFLLIVPGLIVVIIGLMKSIRNQEE